MTPKVTGQTYDTGEISRGIMAEIVQESRPEGSSLQSSMLPYQVAWNNNTEEG
jgi:hypothetical protein